MSAQIQTTSTEVSHFTYTNKMGGGAQNYDDANYMTDIHMVQDIQPCVFNHVHCRGVVTKARSVHLIHSMDWKLGWKGGVRTHQQQHHPLPQRRPFSMKCWLEAHQKSTNNTTQQHQNTLCCQCHSTTSPHNDANPPPVRVEEHHLHTVTHPSHTDSLSSSQTVPANPPGSSTYINWWTWIWRLLPGQWRGVVKVKDHR